MKTSFQIAAEELAEAFTSDTRTSGGTFYKLSDKAPAWTTEENDDGECLMLRIHRAVDDRLPDDWIYEQAYWLANRIAETEGADSARDDLSQWADNLVDVYNNARSAWLASHLYNAALVDEAVEEMGGHSPDGVFGDIALGQYMALERIGHALINEIKERAEAMESAIA